MRALAVAGLLALLAFTACDRTLYPMGYADWRTGPTPSARCHVIDDRCVGCHWRRPQ